MKIVGFKDFLCTNSNMIHKLMFLMNYYINVVCFVKNVETISEINGKSGNIWQKHTKETLFLGSSLIVSEVMVMSIAKVSS